MSELEGAPALIDPALALAAELARQLRDGELTQAEYDEAFIALASGVETGPRCRYCDKAAYIGATCAAHASLSAVAAIGQAHRRRLDDAAKGTTR